MRHLESVLTVLAFLGVDVARVVERRKRRPKRMTHPQPYAHGWLPEDS